MSKKDDLIRKKRAEQNKYINIHSFLSDNYPMTYIIGARGVGKTIHAFSEFIRDCAQHDTKFIYLRRYQTEIDELGIDLPLISELSGYDVTRDVIKDETGRTADCLLADGKVVCYLQALSVAGKYKSNSYKDVEMIVYDEFIDPKGRELKNEVKLFMNFAMTVYREFGKYKVLFLANATNLYNCYFLEFQILPKGIVTKFKELGIKIVMYQTSAMLDQERNSTVLARQVRLLEGENGSSLSNHFDNEFNDFLTKLDKTCHYKSTLKLSGQLFGLYQSQERNIRVVSSKYNHDAKYQYACSFDDVAPGFPQLQWESYSFLRNAFMANQLYFTDVHTRTMFLKWFKHNNMNME